MSTAGLSLNPAGASSSTSKVPSYLLPMIAIFLGTLAFSVLRRRVISRRATKLPLEPLAQVHDWKGDRVEILVERARGRRWVGRVRFRDEALVWEEYTATRREAYRRAVEFFQQACPDHECGPRCGPISLEQPPPE